MEERIKNLEEELKLLKNQIHAVLLDIKEHLANSNGQYSAPRQSTGPAAPDPALDMEPTAEPAQEPEPISAVTDDGSQGSAAEQAEPQPRSSTGHPRAGDSNIKNADGEVQVDLPTVAIIEQWLARAIAAVGREQVKKLVETYDIGANLPPRLKQTMLRLAEFCNDDGGDENSPVRASIPLLIELDSLLLRLRTGAVETVAVLSLLRDRKTRQ